MNHSDPTGFLTEGLEAGQQQRLGDLQSIEQALSTWQVPDPTTDEQAAFVLALAGQLPYSSRPRFGLKGWLKLVLAQARLF